MINNPTSGVLRQGRVCDGDILTQIAVALKSRKEQVPMKRFTRIAIGLSVLVVVCAWAIMRVQKPAAYAVGPQQQNDKRRQKLAHARIEDFHGEAAAAHVRQLRRLSKGIGRAMQDAEQRGLKRSFEHSRVIVGIEQAGPPTAAAHVALPKLNGGRPTSTYSLVHSQETFTDGDYEVTFIPYDDGDPNNWEGVIYRYDPDWGDDIRFVVLDIQTDQPAAIEEVYYPPDGGNPFPLDPNDPSPIITQNEMRTCKPTAAFLSVESKQTVSSRLAALPPCPAGFKRCLRSYDECCSPPPNINNWFKCSAKSCVGVAAGCSKTGPAFGDCWGFGCTGAMLMCLL
jgi:hypothetical protein